MMEWNDVERIVEIVPLNVVTIKFDDYKIVFTVQCSLFGKERGLSTTTNRLTVYSIFIALDWPYEVTLTVSQTLSLLIFSHLECTCSTFFIHEIHLLSDSGEETIAFSFRNNITEGQAVLVCLSVLVMCPIHMFTLILQVHAFE